MDEIKISAEPVDNHRCKFTVSVPILSGGARHFASAAEAAGSPLAEALLAIPHVDDVLIAGPTVTVTKRDTAPWQAAGRAVGAAIRDALQSGVPAVALAAAKTDPVADDSLFDKVSMIFDTRINPQVAGHGGKVDLIDVQDGIVMLRLMGGCQGCGMADVTLRQGIEATLKQVAPEIRGIVDVTDHAHGDNPYFASAKK
ncbi:MAG TPA: NifU family protein [Gemmatimonadales bacterium]|jgi:Fe-S cluster biogenesis protein NfuA